MEASIGHGHMNTIMVMLICLQRNPTFLSSNGSTRIGRLSSDEEPMETLRSQQPVKQSIEALPTCWYDMPLSPLRFEHTLTFYIRPSKVPIYPKAK